MKLDIAKVRGSGMFTLLEGEKLLTDEKIQTKERPHIMIIEKISIEENTERLYTELKLEFPDIRLHITVFAVERGGREIFWEVSIHDRGRGIIDGFFFSPSDGELSPDEISAIVSEARNV
mgnify:CR=1 FL=1|tara:strand:+ start:1728 stop:2087 length:360 start_codon:yes stop_codon:yes gene_type:complete